MMLKSALIVLAAAMACVVPAMDMRITSITSCDANGNAYVPKLGDPTYGLRVNWSISGTVPVNYSIKFELGGQTYHWANIASRAPGSYWGYRLFNAPLDGTFPVKVTLDPSNVTGDTNHSNNILPGQITPVPTNSNIEFFNFQFWNGTQQLRLTKSGTGTFSKVLVVLGRPTNETSQGSVTGAFIPGGTQLTTQPFGDMASFVRYLNPTNPVITVNQSFRLRAANVRINAAKLNQTWGQLNSLPFSIQPFAQPEARIQSDNAAFVAFVGRHLPSNYKSTTRPIDAARSLFLGVAKEMTMNNTTPITALQALNALASDSMGLSMVYVASLRRSGIPARVVSGWKSGTNKWAVWSEMWLPTVGWIPQDVALCESLSPSGAFAYGFATINDLNQRATMSRATAHVVDGVTFGPLWKGEYSYTRSSGNAVFNILQTCTLTP